MASKFRQLFEQNVMRSMDKQKAMIDIHPQQQWEFDQPNCKLTLVENGTSFQVQILGMEDRATNLWRWGWTETMSDFPTGGLVAAKKMQLLGNKYDIPEFLAGELSLDEVSAQDIAIIATGVLNASCYWAVSEPGQPVLYMLIMPDQIEISPDCSPKQLAINIPQTIGGMEIHNHKRAIKSYLKDCGYQAQQQPGQIVAVHQGSPAITMSFDETNRLTELKATLLEAGEAALGEADSDTVSGLEMNPLIDSDKSETSFLGAVQQAAGGAGDTAGGMVGNVTEAIDGVAGDVGAAVAGAGQATVDAGQSALGAIASPFGAVAAGAAGLGAAGIAGVSAAANAANDVTADGIESAASAIGIGTADATEATGAAIADAGAAADGAVKKKSSLLKILLLLLIVFVVLAVLGWVLFAFVF